MQNNGWAAKDEAALRVQYSFKYSVVGCPPGVQPRNKGFPSAEGTDSEVFIAFTGQFDFYWLLQDTRDSGPVINRLSNPGLHWRLPVRKFFPSMAPNSSVVLSFEHLSNGQVFEPTDGSGPAVLRSAYESRERPVFDTISRGTNFLGVEVKADQTLGKQRVDLLAKFRVYIDRDDAVTWGPLRDSNPRVSDYERVLLRAGTDAGRWGYWELTWRLGDRGLRTDSYALGWQAPDTWALPVYARIHAGPMNTFSNYTQRQDSVGVGLRFTAF
jgi:outer membrane phospholipase A